MKTRTALVIDDDQNCRALFSTILKNMDFEVLAFSNPSEFLVEKDWQQCTKSCPCVDVLITDNNMPGMSGLEFLEFLDQKCCKLEKKQKAIISGSWPKDQLDRAIKIGCSIFPKPVVLTEIYEWLNECLEKDRHLPW